MYTTAFRWSLIPRSTTLPLIVPASEDVVRASKATASRSGARFIEDWSSIRIRSDWVVLDASCDGGACRSRISTLCSWGTKRRAALEALARTLGGRAKRGASSPHHLAVARRRHLCQLHRESGDRGEVDSATSRGSSRRLARTLPEESPQRPAPAFEAPILCLGVPRTPRSGPRYVAARLSRLVSLDGIDTRPAELQELFE